MKGEGRRVGNSEKGWRERREGEQWEREKARKGKVGEKGRKEGIVRGGQCAGLKEMGRERGGRPQKFPSF
jgi:hypothetical protein